jgi:hypothetical protein
MKEGEDLSAHGAILLTTGGETKSILCQRERQKGIEKMNSGNLDSY